jgi:hypothetical protein
VFLPQRLKTIRTAEGGCATQVSSRPKFYRDASVYGDAACRVPTSKSYSKQAIQQIVEIPGCTRYEKTSRTAEGDGKLFAQPRAAAFHVHLGTLEDDRDPSLHSGLKTQRVTSVLTCSLLKGRSAMVPSAGLICQMSRAYSAMVRSLEKTPTRATFRMALLAQRSACW